MGSVYVLSCVSKLGIRSKPWKSFFILSVILRDLKTLALALALAPALALPLALSRRYSSLVTAILCCSVVWYNAPPLSTIQDNTRQYKTIRDNTIQFVTVYYATI